MFYEILFGKGIRPRERIKTEWVKGIMVQILTPNKGEIFNKQVQN